MTAKFDGNHGADCIVRGIHEMNRPAVFHKEFRILHATVISCGDDGVRLLNSGLLKRLHGAPEGPFEDAAHAPALDGRNHLPEVRILCPEGHYAEYLYVTHHRPIRLWMNHCLQSRRRCILCA